MEKCRVEKIISSGNRNDMISPAPSIDGAKFRIGYNYAIFYKKIVLSLLRANTLSVAERKR